MRTALIETLCELAAEDERIMLLTADLGWSVVEPFRERFPRRFLNVGVAEANMMGVATGLAQLGYVPFVYSIATFASMRGYEQLRDGPILHQLPVRVIGIGGGFAYGHAGPTHHALEDLCIGRAQPGLTVLAPADPAQTRTILRETASLPGPAYFRIGKGGNAEVPGLQGRFALNRPELVREGEDVLFLTVGSIAHEALDAAKLLAASGHSAAVAVLAHLPHQSSAALAELLADYALVVSVEEGFAAGGLGSLTAETIAENGLSCRLAIRAVRRNFAGASGSERWMRAQHGLDAASLVAAVEQLANAKA
ncbi:MAG: transketolase family protein [Planctomycetota bacterium]